MRNGMYSIKEEQHRGQITKTETSLIEVNKQLFKEYLGGRENPDELTVSERGNIVCDLLMKDISIVMDNALHVRVEDIINMPIE